MPNLIDGLPFYVALSFCDRSFLLMITTIYHSHGLWILGQNVYDFFSSILRDIIPRHAH